MEEAKRQFEAGWMGIGRAMVALIATLSVAACSPAPSPSEASSPPLAFEFPVDCGPIQDPALCRKAVEVAATAKLNPPPIVEATLRRPRPDDECVTAFHPCGPEAIIVVIQRGDTLQDVPLVRTAEGWVRLDLVR